MMCLAFFTARRPVYTFKEARYGSYLGDTIRYIQTVRSSTTNYVYFRSYEQYYYNGPGFSTNAWQTPTTTALSMHMPPNYVTNGTAYTSVDYYSSSSTITTRDVYLIYKGDNSATPGQGEDHPDSSQDDLDLPYISKTLEKNFVEGNWDGTYTLSLDVTGAAESDVVKTTADVIIVLDASGSMGRNNDPTTGTSRWTVATSSVKSLVNSLLSYNAGYASTAADIPVRISIIKFSSEASTLATNITTTNQANQVNYGTADGGTNWEAALMLASDISTRETANKYVLFISDGNPTNRQTQGSTSNPYSITTYDGNSSRYGPGNDIAEPAHYIIRCYTQARRKAKELVDDGFNFYSIAVYAENVYRMQNLLSYAYTGFDQDIAAPADHYFNASDQTAIQNAFSGIVNTITRNFDFIDVSITDPLTAATSTSLSIAGHAKDYTYEVYKALYDGSGNLVKDSQGRTVKDSSVADADVRVKEDGSVSLKFPGDGETYTVPGASFSGNTVSWSLGNAYALKNGYTYRVSFTVWPNQDEYDAIVELNLLNRETDRERISEILLGHPSRVYVEASQKYMVYSNGDATLDYAKRSVIGGDSTITEQTPLHYARPKMETLLSAMKVSKVWDETDASGRPEEIVLAIQEDGEAYQEVTLSASDAVAGSVPVRWEKTIYISPGIIKTDIQEEAINSGHEYTCVETDAGDASYDFASEGVRPMLVDGIMRYLGDADGNTDLTGTNSSRSSLILSKQVTNAKEDDTEAEFTFAITLGEEGDPDIWFCGSDGMEKPLLTVSGNVSPEVCTIDNPTYNAATGQYTYVYEGQTYHLYAADGGTPMNGVGRAYTGRYHVDAGTPFTVKLKAGWDVGFLSLPLGTAYIIRETDMPAGFSLQSITACYRRYAGHLG